MVSTNGTHPARGLRDEAGTSESRRAIRRLCRNGNSTTVGVPPEFLNRMHVLPGDFVELIYDDEWEGFFVRRHVRPPIVSPRSQPSPRVTDGA